MNKSYDILIINPQIFIPYYTLVRNIRDNISNIKSNKFNVFESLSLSLSVCVVAYHVVQIIENFDRYKKHFINTHSINLMSKDFSGENKSFICLET